jgi:hypothetical protein
MMEAASAQGKCIKQYARIAGKSAKCLSSQLKAGLSIAGTATRNTRNSKSYLRGVEFSRFIFNFYFIFKKIKNYFFFIKIITRVPSRTTNRVAATVSIVNIALEP